MTASKHNDMPLSETAINDLVARAARAMQRSLDRRMAEAELTAVQWSLLARCREADTMTQTDLALSLGIQPSGIARLVERLVNKGLATRVAADGDRRVSRVGLTARGRELASSLIPEARAVLNKHLTGFQPNEVDALQAYLRRIVGNAQPEP